MKYRKYGRTDVEISEIGLGGHREGVEKREGIARSARFFLAREERARVVGKAIDSGVNYFDTTFGCEIESLGESLRLLKRRDGLFVSGMRVDFFGCLLCDELDVRAYTRREVEGRLRESGLEYLDQFMLGALDPGYADPLAHPRSMMEDTLDELYKMRDEGKLRFVGFSCHSPNHAAKILQAFPNFDSVMTPYNFANREAEGNLADALAKTGAAWIAMKPLVWRAYGVPVTVLRNLKPTNGFKYDPSAQISKLALQFILQNPHISTCVPAMNSLACVGENILACDCGKLTADDLEQLENFREAMLTDDGALMAMGGLFETNLRIRAFSLMLACGRFGYKHDEIDWDADDAEEKAQAVAEDFLEQLRQDPQWAGF